jgi:hypothetical protein
MTRTVTWGLALSTDGFALVRPTGRGVGEVVASGAFADAAARTSGVAAAFRTMHAEGTHSDCTIALLPSLADVRVLSLPDLPRDEITEIVSEDLRRFVPTTAVRGAVELDDQRGTESAGVRRVLLTSADERLVEELLESASKAQVTVRRVVSALSAWSASAGSQSDWFQVDLGESQLAFEMRDGTTTAIRRWVSHAPQPPVTATRLTGSNDASLALAATWAPVSTAHGLSTAQQRTQRVRRVWRAASAVFVAGVGLAAVAAAVLWVRVGRIIESAERERAVIAGSVSAAVALRDSAMALNARAHALERFRAEQPDWIALLRGLDAALPDESFLTSLRASPDSLVLTGEGDRATVTLDRLSADRMFESVRFDAPIQQRIDAGEVVGERYVIAARIRKGTETP